MHFKEAGMVEAISLYFCATKTAMSLFLNTLKCEGQSLCYIIFPWS